MLTHRSSTSRIKGGYPGVGKMKDQNYSRVAKEEANLPGSGGCTNSFTPGFLPVSRSWSLCTFY